MPRFARWWKSLLALALAIGVLGACAPQPEVVIPTLIVLPTFTETPSPTATFSPTDTPTITAPTDTSPAPSDTLPATETPTATSSVVPDAVSTTFMLRGAPTFAIFARRSATALAGSLTATATASLIGSPSATPSPSPTRTFPPLALTQATPIMLPSQISGLGTPAFQPPTFPTGQRRTAILRPPTMTATLFVQPTATQGATSTPTQALPVDTATLTPTINITDTVTPTATETVTETPTESPTP